VKCPLIHAEKLRRQRVVVAAAAKTVEQRHAQLTEQQFKLEECQHPIAKCQPGIDQSPDSPGSIELVSQRSAELGARISMDSS